MKKNDGWDGSYLKGREDNAKVVTMFNKHCREAGVPLRMYHQHPVQKVMTLPEKVKNNKIPNRLWEAEVTKAMGMDCYIEDEVKSRRLHILTRYSNDFNFFLKLPSGICSDEEIRGYLRTIEHYYILFTDRPNGIVLDKYGPLTPLKNLIKHVPYGLETSKGNRNRLTFEYSPAKLLYLPFEAKRGKWFFTTTLLDQIKEAMK